MPCQSLRHRGDWGKRIWFCATCAPLRKRGNAYHIECVQVVFLCWDINTVLLVKGLLAFAVVIGNERRRVFFQLDLFYISGGKGFLGITFDMVLICCASKMINPSDIARVIVDPSCNTDQGVLELCECFGLSKPTTRSESKSRGKQPSFLNLVHSHLSPIDELCLVFNARLSAPPPNLDLCWPFAVNVGWFYYCSTANSKISTVKELRAEHSSKYPKDGELCLRRMKPEETLVEVRSDTDVQIVRQTWVKGRKTHRTI